MEMFAQNFLLYLFTFGTSATITLLGIPVVNRVAKTKNLFDVPNYRSSHKSQVPRLGGMVIFIASVLGFTIWLGNKAFPELASIIAALIIIFFTGVKDDIVGMRPLTKLTLQIFSATLLSFGGKLRIASLYGLFGIQELPLVISILITILVVVFLINSFNLIDGVDGLAGGLGIIATFTFGVIFYAVEEHAFVLLAMSLIGSLATFLCFNFSNKWKIFMGDTGSMVIGLIISILTLKFLNLENKISLLQVGFVNLPYLSVLILFIPIFDTLRVFTIRLFLGKSPFSPDKNHMHHMLLNRVSKKHAIVSIIMYTLNIAPIIVGFLLLKNLNLLESSVLFVSVVLLYVLLVQILSKSDMKSN